MLQPETYTDDVTVALVDSMGSDLSIVRAARVSVTDAPETLDESPDAVAGLLRYLVRMRHGSPLEAGTLQFRIAAPIFVAREFMRHRVGVSVNETSGRYRQLDGEFWLPPEGRPLREPGAFKPARPMLLEDEGLRSWVKPVMAEAYKLAWRNYLMMIDRGVAREVARSILPVGLFTHWYATLNPRAMMHMLSLRTYRPNSAVRSYALAEFDTLASRMEVFFAERFPLTHAAFEEAGRVAP